MEYQYFKEINGNLLIRYARGEMIERYDTQLKRWVEDIEMAQIYFGGILAKPITESEANKLIEARLKS